ncbi:hypothetical protein Tco_1057901 [Tanacetum coccineum]|uniref:Uncharacterized protein n=1 Tax=Tanacetum coccineum TaxID=301880 RepID=A0ABQ5H6W9_9ASTR
MMDSRNTLLVSVKVPVAVVYPIYQLIRLLILGEKWMKTTAESFRLHHSQLLYRAEAIKKQASPCLQ